MSNDLVSPSDLATLPGYEGLSSTWLDVAVEELRDELGWHVAPVREETITVYASSFSSTVILPSQRVVDVTDVVSSDGEVVYTSFALIPPDSLWCPTTWWQNPIDVTLTHGFDSCPASLLPVVLRRALRVGQANARAVTSASVGSVSIAYQSELAARQDARTLSRYSVQARVG